MTFDEIKKGLECHAAGDICSTCPFVGSAHCSENMARAALDALDTKAEPLDQRQMALKTVMMALDKGGFSVTVNPDGTVMCHPWYAEETLELPLVAKFLDNYIRRVEFNVPRWTKRS